MDLYIHSLISVHGVVLNWFSTGTTLPLSSVAPKNAPFMRAALKKIHVRTTFASLPTFTAHIQTSFFQSCLTVRWTASLDGATRTENTRHYFSILTQE
jgi:hypothetical protein